MPGSPKRPESDDEDDAKKMDAPTGRFSIRDADDSTLDGQDEEEDEDDHSEESSELPAPPNPPLHNHDDEPTGERTIRSEPESAHNLKHLDNDEPDTETKRAEPVSMDRERAVFHSARFFSDLDFEQKNKLWAIGETIEFGEEYTILDFNDEPKGVYVIVGGHIDVYKLVRSSEKYIDRMREGQSFGELWLLADQPTAVKFVAAKPVKVHVIGRDDFDDLMDKDGTVARKLYKRFTMRLLRRLLTSQNNKPKSEAS